MILMLSFLVSPVPAAMFARDHLIFLKDGSQITGNTLLIQWGLEPDARIDICRDGHFIRTQHVAPLSFRIFKLPQAPMPRSQWHEKSRSFSGAEAEAYERYLIQKSKTALYSCVFSIPEAENSPPAYSRETKPQTSGSTAGVDRFFTIDTESGAVCRIGPDGKPLTGHAPLNPENSRPVTGKVIDIQADRQITVRIPSAKGIGPGSLVRVFTGQSPYGMAARAGIWKVSALMAMQVHAVALEIESMPELHGTALVFPLGDFSDFKRDALDHAHAAGRYFTQKEYHKAANSYTLAAELGHAFAMVRLGDICHKGLGRDRDDEQAVFWYTKAAREKNTTGIYRLGQMAAKGLGMKKNLGMAAHLFKEAARKGNPRAQYDLGVLYYKGAGVVQNDAKAVAWFKKAASHQIKEAWFALGVIHETGRGTPPDLIRAIECYEAAQKLGDKRASEKISKLPTFP